MTHFRERPLWNASDTLGIALPLASAHVVADSVASHVVQRVRLIDIFGFFANDNHQLRLVIGFAILSTFWNDDDLVVVTKGCNRLDEQLGQRWRTATAFLDFEW